MDRAVGARPIAGNLVRHHADSPGALAAMLAMIAGARRLIHLENYIIRGDRTGARFADALVERAAAGVTVRVLYDGVGSFSTPARFWRRLQDAGIEVRAFHRPVPWRPIEFFSRDHRKLITVDGDRAMLGGMCIGAEWEGEVGNGSPAWRDTTVAVEGPAVPTLDRAFAATWRLAGAPLPASEDPGDVEPRGPGNVRVIAGSPGRVHIYRAAQLVYATAVQRIWVTDAYLVAPPTLLAAILDAAQGGVDVRMLVPSTSDLPVLRTFTRIGYREMLQAGVRIFEWLGPMLHAKTMVVDRRWARVGSSNLNYSSLLANYELDILVESDTLCDELAAQFERDLVNSREVVLHQRRYLRTGVGQRVADAERLPRPPRSRYERQVQAAVTLRRVAGGLRRRLAASAAATFTVLGVLALFFPRTTSVMLAVIAFLAAIGMGRSALRRRIRPDAEPDEASAPVQRIATGTQLPT
jgi:cardiolipin synthase